METYFYTDHARKAGVIHVQIWYLSLKRMQYHVIAKKKKGNLGCCFLEEIFYMFVDFFVKILTRKHEKDLQLIWH